MTKFKKRELVIVLHIGNADQTAQQLSQFPADVIVELMKAIAKLIADHKLL